MTIKELFKDLPVLKPDSKILLLTHNDLDGSGPAILLQYLFGKNNVTVQHMSNAPMHWKIRNAIIYDDTSDYDAIIITDISCKEEYAETIDLYLSKNPKTVILLDHHDSAKHLNQYKWASVLFDMPEDCMIYEYYPNKDKHNIPHMAATTLMYEYLNYIGLWKTESEEQQRQFEKFVHIVTAWDTWDWNTILNADTSYKHLDTLLDTYSQEIFEEMWLDKLLNNEPLINDMDKTMLKVEETKAKKHINNISKVIRTGNICINNKYYSIVYCHSENYITDTADYMKETYPDYDLYLIDFGLGLSFRTVKPDVHCGMILKEFGGGGHAGAGGIRYSMDNCLELISATLGNSKIILDEKEKFQGA